MKGHIINPLRYRIHFLHTTWAREARADSWAPQLVDLSLGDVNILLGGSAASSSVVISSIIPT